MFGYSKSLSIIDHINGRKRQKPHAQFNRCRKGLSKLPDKSLRVNKLEGKTAPAIKAPTNAPGKVGCAQVKKETSPKPIALPKS